MFEDDGLPHFKKETLMPRKLDGLSRDELTEYLEFLAVEEKRTEDALQAKGSFNSAADALFKI